MKTKLLWMALLLWSLSARAGSTASGDEAALRAIPVAFCQAWANHDGHQLAQLMSETVDFVTVGGTWLQGRADFETYHTRILSGRFRQSTIRLLQSEVRFLSARSALVHWTWTIEGDFDPDGTPRPPRYGLMTMLAQKERGRWLVVSAHNTNAAPAEPPEQRGIHSPLGFPRPAAATSQEGRTMNLAKGVFEVQVLPQGEPDKAVGSTLGRLSLDKQFHGALEGTGKGQMLTAGTDVKGSAAYVALERVTATLDGRSGSFVLLHHGLMNSTSQQLSLTVVPDSGSGALTGITGTMTIVVAGGKHSYEFHYSLPAGG